MLTRLRVEHFKSIENIDLHLSNLSLFVGPNGSGKSNIIDAIRLVRDAVTFGLDRAVAERHGIDSIRQWSPSKPYHVTIEMHTENRLGEGFLSLTLASYRGNHSVHREEAEWRFRDDRRPSAGYSRLPSGKIDLWMGNDRQTERCTADQPEELFLRQIEARRLRALVQSISNFRAYSIFPNILRTPQKPSSERQLSSTGDNLTSIFRTLAKSKRANHQRARQEIIESLKRVMPTLENIRIQNIGGLMVPQFRVRERAERLHDFNVSQVSDGTLRVLGLLTALYQPNRPQVIAMEEPEQTVHPGVLSVLADSIKEVSAQTQILVTTHSPELLDKFDAPDAVMAVDSERGITHVGRISNDQREAVRDRLFTLGELMSIEGLHQ